MAARAPRSLWNGTIAFGMVSVPVKLYTATDSRSISFHEVHARDGARIEHRRVCSEEDKEVPYDQVVKGYEVTDGRYVVLEGEEIKAAAGARGKVIRLEEFVGAGQIDPVFYEKSYYVGSRDEQAPFALLHEALRKSGRVGVGRFTFHDREYLVALRARDEVLVLDTLRFHDEVVSGGDLDLGSGARKPSKREVEMAEQLVRSFETEFDPDDYEDTYRDAVLNLIKRKAAGKEIDLAAEEEPEQGDDLMAALSASVGARK